MAEAEREAANCESQASVGLHLPALTHTFALSSSSWSCLGRCADSLVTMHLELYLRQTWPEIHKVSTEYWLDILKDAYHGQADGSRCCYSSFFYLVAEILLSGMSAGPHTCWNKLRH